MPNKDQGPFKCCTNIQQKGQSLLRKAACLSTLGMKGEDCNDYEWAFAIETRVSNILR